ncbi:MAG: hypothetical protein HPY83_01310 [Anaerolineae bacterium]|nr:hypothetical protein [Anaerolineae bacterium]
MMIRFLLPLLSLLAWSALGRPAAPVPAPQGEPAPSPGIYAAQVHLVLVPVDGAVRVAELHVLSNQGDDTYLGTEVPGGGRRTVGFRLPAGATNLRFDGPGLGERFMEEPGGFHDTEPIPPGEGTVRVQYSYDLPLQPGLTLTLQSEVPVASVVAIVTGEGLELLGTGLAYQGTVDTQMGPAAYYTAGPLESGQKLQLSLMEVEAGGASAAPEQGIAPSRSTTTEWGLGLASVALAAAAAYALWRPGGPGPMPESVRGPVEELASLEEALERGSLTPEEYGRRRAALVRRIRARLVSREGGA